jgi:hypothetical protein
MANEPNLHIIDNSNKNTPIWLNIFWLGFLIYIIGTSISLTDTISWSLCNKIQLIGLLMFLPTGIILIRSRSNNVYLSIVFLLFFIWSLITLVRGFDSDYEAIKYLLFNPFIGLLVYLIPIILLFPSTPLFLKKTFNIIILFGVSYVLLDIVFIRILLAPYKGFEVSQIVVETFSNHLSLPCGFFLMTYIYHSKKLNLFALFILFLTFLFAAIRARRGLMFMSFSMITVSYIFYQYVNKKRLMNIILSFFIISIVSFAAVKIYQKNRNDTFGYITQRIADDSRSYVETYFYNDMTHKELAVGKGYNGKYYCPTWDETTGIPSSYRNVIETGYSQMILNGGIISIVLFLLIAIPAIYKGLFSSINILSKVAAIWILLFLIFSYPTYPNGYSLFYILVWISIGICYSDELRSISDDKLKEYFSNNKAINT